VPINRLVVLLTPLVFAPLAGFISLQLAKLGVHMDTNTVQGAVVSGAVFLGGVAVAFLKSKKWLQGWQDWEKRQDWITHAALDQRFTVFLEELAEKTGTKLPSADALPLVTANAAEPDPPPPAFEPGAMSDSAPGE
jgi:hypothetical protein